ncbi:hypothetical protein LR48_Vigan02g124300 [Vigna angularis]|uniref:Uncharacterized protein n=1 Tax=Phaseolus angularis TaxID=3914 RepID=A0A0L9TWY0_PHAAN|nr:hypothetical protein LR48_Vigan02g124300 [Vigna angularis]
MRYIHPRQEGDRSACTNTDRPTVGVWKRASGPDVSADVLDGEILTYKALRKFKYSRSIFESYSLELVGQVVGNFDSGLVALVGRVLGVLDSEF